MLTNVQTDRNVDYSYHWRRFSTATSIHGMIYLNKKQKSNRRVWIPIILASLTLCVWQSVINIQDYFSFNIVTKVTYSADEDVEFPAITIWNSNIIRRTVIGRRLESKMLWAYKFGLDIKKVNKTCDYKPAQPDYLDTKLDMLLKRFSEITDGYMITQELIDAGVDLITVNQKMTFIKCWLENKETDCDLIVLNTVIDTNNYLNPTYSVNLDPKVACLFLSNDTLGVSLRNERYQENMKFINRHYLTPSDNGYKFLLNVNEEDYCMYKQEIWYGVGLHATIHGRLSFPMEVDTIGTIYLKPGFYYNVVLKPKMYRRNTAHLGKCVSSAAFYFVQTKTYTKTLCQLECINEIIWKSCHCVVLTLPALRKAFSIKHNLNDNQTTFCGINSNFSECLYNLPVFNDNFSKEKLCPYCKQPCEETEYNFDVTATSFPPQHLSKYYARMLNVSDHNSLRKNYLMLNVFFESKSVNLIEDNQAYTWIDLFIFIGSNIGLFLGMSFMSFHELVHHSAEVLIDVIQRRVSFPNVKHKLKSVSKIPTKMQAVIKKIICFKKLKNNRQTITNKRKSIATKSKSSRKKVTNRRRSTVTTLHQIRNVKVHPNEK